MSVLTRRERRQLIDLLLSLPNVADIRTRRILLLGLPSTLQNAVPSRDDAQTDISTMLSIVDGDTWAVLEDGTWSVAVIIENAQAMVRGSSLSTELAQMLTAINIRPRPGAAVRNDPQELPDRTPAQATLYDLHRLLVEIQERTRAAIEQVDHLQVQSEPSE